MNKTLTTKVVALVASVMLLASPMAGLAVEQASVAIQNNAFSPRNITVQVGTIVTWRNFDVNMPHTVTSDNGLFNSGTLNYNDSFSVQFNGTGTYNYYCQFHGGPGGVGMAGIVTVINGTPPPALSTLTGTVTAPQNTIVVNSITPVKTSGSADDTFQNGWSWVFDVSAPQNETNLMMKFDNWLMSGPAGNIISAANNMRFYSPQSSNAYGQNNAIYITAPNTYSSAMVLNGDLDPGPRRRVQITVEVKIPSGTQQGSYTTNFGIKTQ